MKLDLLGFTSGLMKDFTLAYSYHTIHCVFVKVHGWMETCVNEVHKLNESRAWWQGERGRVVWKKKVHGNGERAEVGNLSWEREREKNNLCNPSAWTSPSGILLWSNVASKKDHVIKVIQSREFGHGLGNIHYTYPRFHYASNCTQHTVLFSSTSTLLPPSLTRRIH